MSKPWYAFSKRAAAFVAVSALTALLGDVGAALVLAAEPAGALVRGAELPTTELSLSERESSLRVGDSVVYRLAQPGWQIDPGEGGLKKGYLFRPGRLFTPLVAGEVQLPELRVIDETGAAVAKTSPVQIPVESNLTDQDRQNPKGPQPEPAVGPLGLPFPPWIQTAAAFLGFGVVVGMVFFLVRYLRRRAARALKAMLPKKPYDVATLERLDDLLKAGWIEKKNLKPYVFGISDAMKFYLGERFAFDAEESTTSELLTSLRTKIGSPGLNEATVSRVENLFLRLDLVKFADQIPSDEDARGILREARELVTSTRKVAAEPILKGAGR